MTSLDSTSCVGEEDASFPIVSDSLSFVSSFLEEPNVNVMGVFSSIFFSDFRLKPNVFEVVDGMVVFGGSKVLNFSLVSGIVTVDEVIFAS